MLANAARETAFSHLLPLSVKHVHVETFGVSTLICSHNLIDYLGIFMLDCGYMKTNQLKKLLYNYNGTQLQ